MSLKLVGWVILLPPVVGWDIIGCESVSLPSHKNLRNCSYSFTLIKTKYSSNPQLHGPHPDPTISASWFLVTVFLINEPTFFFISDTIRGPNLSTHRITIINPKVIYKLPIPDPTPPSTLCLILSPALPLTTHLISSARSCSSPCLSCGSVWPLSPSR